jgi:hypothetical protein
VDHAGSTWVANRAESSAVPAYDQNMGSITRIALLEGGTRCDENGNENAAVEQYLKPPFDYCSVGDWGLLDRNPPYGLIKTSYDARFSFVSFDRTECVPGKGAQRMRQVLKIAETSGRWGLTGRAV